MNKTKKLIALILCLTMVISGFSMTYGEDFSAKDYEGHWAQSIIQKWLDEGKISGYPDGNFRPDNFITRAEFVKLVNSIIDYDTFGNITYSDIKKGDWYYDIISIAQEIGYISGYSDKKFGPNDNVTREQAAAILSRIQYLGSKEASANKFSDKDRISSWALGAVGAASDAGFINGYFDSSFKPGNYLTRAEAITMLDNVLVNSKNIVIYKAGTELKDTNVEGDLIIAKTVGDGDVYLTNIEVGGEIKVYGGGINSIYFNNVKISKIEVNKDKVRLVFEDGTTVEEISVGSETILENTNGQISKVTVSTTGQVTLTGSFEEISVLEAKDIVLNEAIIKTIVIEKPVTILGTGTIEKLEANADGIQYEADVEVDEVTVGENVTEEPEPIVEAPVTGGGGGGGVPTPKKYAIGITVEIDDGSISNKTTFTSEEYSSTSIISDFLINQLVDVLPQKSTIVNNYLEIAENRINGISIGETPLYIDGRLNEVVWDKLINNLAQTAIVSELTGLEDRLSDGLVTEDLISVLNLYDVYKNGDGTLNNELLVDDLTNILTVLDSKEITYDGDANYVIKYKDGELSDPQETLSFVLENIAFSTKTVSDFFNEFGTVITVDMEYLGKTANITIERILLH